MPRTTIKTKLHWKIKLYYTSSISISYHAAIAVVLESTDRTLAITIYKKKVRVADFTLMIANLKCLLEFSR